MPMTASAPGKVLWAGEYAVLDGAPAVVVAVARRAVARVGQLTDRLSPFLEEARRAIVDRFGAASEEAQRAAQIRVDSQALEQDGKKLGIGSSAAATVAAIAAAIGRDDPRLIHDLAHRAHGAAQAPRGARGSGADIAASVHGGVIAVVQPIDDPSGPLTVERLALPAELAVVLIWSGTPADTPRLVARVRELRDRDPSSHRHAIDLLGHAGESLRTALRANDINRTIAAITEGSQALAELGRRAGAPLVPPIHDQIARLAHAHGGAAKPTGAGGGDLLLAVFPSLPAADAFRIDATNQQLTLIDAPVDATGVALAPPPRSA
jgi:phosphomevalonate kinase